MEREMLEILEWDLTVEAGSVEFQLVQKYLSDQTLALLSCQKMEGYSF